MYTESSFGKILLILASWVLQKKKPHTGQNLQKKQHKTAHFTPLFNNNKILCK